MKTVAIIIWLALVCGGMAVSKDDFTLSVIYDGKPVKEFTEDGKLRVAISFGSEYKLRLKNTHNRRCSVKIIIITIDGCAVSMLGDIIVNANSEIDLEWFIDASLTEGNKFKFVRLSDPAVDDPTKEENGLIKATFTLEKRHTIQVPVPPYWGPPFLDTNGIPWLYPITGLYHNVIDCSATLSSTPCSASTEPGATVQGSESYQSFRKVEFDGEDESVTLRLWLRGIPDKDFVNEDWKCAITSYYSVASVIFLTNEPANDVKNDNNLQVRGDVIIGTNASPIFKTFTGDVTVDPSGHIDVVKAITDEGIRKLCKSGRVCKVVGHNWRAGRPGEGEGSPYGSWYGDYHPNTSYRTCRICGKCESQSLNDWK